MPKISVRFAHKSAISINLHYKDSKHRHVFYYILFYSEQNLTIEQMLEGTTPVETPKHSFKNIAEARSWAKKNIAGAYHNVNTGEDINVSKKAIEKYLSESAIKKSVDLDAHLSALKKLPQLIENSVLVNRHHDRDSDSHIKEIQRLYGAISYKGKISPVKITVKATFYDGSKAYSYEVLEVESPTENPSGNHHQPAPESGLQSSNNPDTSTTVRDLRTSETGLPVPETGAADYTAKIQIISKPTKKSPGREFEPLRGGGTCCKVRPTPAIKRGAEKTSRLLAVKNQASTGLLRKNLRIIAAEMSTGCYFQAARHKELKQNRKMRTWKAGVFYLTLLLTLA
ncbi:MAG: hypothetical protein LBF67_03620 [Prevotellaceae bacterium]|jgi:hypothetical protein|nr:hypothetical protein [Prevotellaceae bacterium]